MIYYSSLLHKDRREDTIHSVTPFPLTLTTIPWRSKGNECELYSSS